jgi:hypothetical protein
MGSPPVGNSYLYPDNEIWNIYGCCEYYTTILLDMYVSAQILFDETVYPVYYKFARPHVNKCCNYMRSFFIIERPKPLAKDVKFVVEYNIIEDENQRNNDGDTGEEKDDLVEESNIESNYIMGTQVNSYNITSYWNTKICREMDKHGSLFSKTVKEILIEYLIENNMFDDFEMTNNIYDIRLNITLENDLYFSGRKNYRFIGEDSKVVPLYMIPK